MPGQQLASFWEGNRAELFSTYVLSGIAAVVAVPRQMDFGADLLCTLTRREGPALYAGRSFGVQVKSAESADFRYGGLSAAGVWKEYELRWLYGQGQPLLFSTVDLKQWRVRLYSPTRMWSVRYMMGWPGEIILVPDFELKGGEFDRKPLAIAKDGSSPGDGFSYRVPLGKPIVDVALDKEETPERKDRIRACIDRWVELESGNIRHFQMRVPYSEEWIEWEPNEVPSTTVKLVHYFNPTPDANVREILFAIKPAVASLFHQLRAQRQATKLEKVLPLCILLQDHVSRRLKCYRAGIVAPFAM